MPSSSEGPSSSGGDTSSSIPEIEPQSITISGASVLETGDTTTLTAAVLPENAHDKSYTWSSLTETIASVDQNGLVTALTSGTAEIKVTTWNGKTDTHEIEISDPFIAVESISIASDKSKILVDETANMSVTFVPKTATDKTITWSSSDALTASVNSEGVVTGLKAGEATITATSHNGKIATSKIIVENPVVPVAGVTITNAGDTMEMTVGDTFQLNAKVEPENATNKKVNWFSTNHQVAKVDENGLLTAIGASDKTVTISVKPEGIKGISDKVELTVKAKPVPVTSVTIDGASEIQGGMSLQLTATVLPSNATDKAVTWASLNEDVATVDQNGLVTTKKAIADTTVTITATAGGVTGKFDINVKRTPIAVESIAIKKDGAEISTLIVNTGSETPIDVEVLPANADNKSVTWTSTNVDVAEVIEGKIIAKKAGTTTLKVISSNVMITKTLDLTVEDIDVQSVAITNKSDFNNKTFDSAVNAVLGKLETKVLPENATNAAVRYESSAPTIAKVDGEGNITVLDDGDVTISAISVADENKKDSVSFKIVFKATSVEITPEEITDAKVEGTTQLNAAVLPENATDKTVTWSSSDDTYATVSETGLVTYLKAGSVTITATTNGTITDTITIAIAEKPVEIIPVESVTLDKTSIEDAVVGSGVKLTATVTPDNATNKTVTWSSSDSNIATVDQAGNVKFVALGEAMITATADGKSASCTVKVVTKLAESIEITGESTVTEGESISLTAKVMPEDATQTAVTWSSSNEAVATVTAEGVVTGVTEGTASITATVNGTGVSAAHEVTVEKKPVAPTSIAFTINGVVAPDEIEIAVGETVTFGALILPEDATHDGFQWSVTGNDDDIIDVGYMTEPKFTALKPGTVSVGVNVWGNGNINDLLKVTVKAPEPEVQEDIVLDFKTNKYGFAESKAAATDTAFTEGNVAFGSTRCYWFNNNDDLMLIENEAAIWNSEAFSSEIKTITIATNPNGSGSCKYSVVYGSSLLANRQAEGTDVFQEKGGVFTLNLTGKGATYFNITNFAGNGQIDSITISFKEPEPVTPSEIAIDGPASVAIGSMIELTAVVGPQGAPQDVVWTSSNPEIATVDENGVVTGIAAGTAEIKAASATVPEVYASHSVEVVDGSTLPDFSGNYGFVTGTGDGTKASTTTLLTEVKGLGDVINGVSVCNNVYSKSSNGLKLGSSSNKGEVTFDIDSTKGVSGVKVTIERYKEEKSAITVKTIGGDVPSQVADFAQVTDTKIVIDIENPEMTQLSISANKASKCRFYISSIVFR